MRCSKGDVRSIRNQKKVMTISPLISEKTAFIFGEYWNSSAKKVKLQTETDIETKKLMFSMQTPKTQPKQLARDLKLWIPNLPHHTLVSKICFRARVHLPGGRGCVGFPVPCTRVRAKCKNVPFCFKFSLEPDSGQPYRLSRAQPCLEVMIMSS